jgi:phosphate transport system substrate-binding protein
MQQQHFRTRRLATLLGVAALASSVLAATVLAGGGAEKPLRGKIEADGSSTVGPWTTAAAELFQKRNPGVKITVGISGTGGGFERFCRGETDLSNASRPIKNSEHVKCLEAGVRWAVFHVANDGIALVVNRQNTWVDCLTTAELRKIWDSGSKVDNWRDVRQGFPDVPLKLIGAGTDSGTFDYFTEAINGKSKRSRSDYLATEDDNVTVQGVSGERGGLGYFGLSYYEENKSRLKLLKVDGGKGCVAPSVATVQNGTYKPLGRPLFIYAKRESFKRAELAAFIGFALNNQAQIAKTSRFVSLTETQAKKARFQYSHTLRKVFGK